MPRGGKRPGAGRPAMAKIRLGAFPDAESFLRALMNDDRCDPALRVRAAGRLLAHDLAVEKFRVQLVPPEED